MTREMTADDIGMGATAVAQREAAAAILDDLRDRRLLKWLFAENADENPVAIGHVDGPIANAVQNEMVAKWVELAWSAFEKRGLR
jgi:hypothetical protein